MVKILRYFLSEGLAGQLWRGGWYGYFSRSVRLTSTMPRGDIIPKILGNAQVTEQYSLENLDPI